LPRTDERSVTRLLAVIRPRLHIVV